MRPWESTRVLATVSGLFPQAFGLSRELQNNKLCGRHEEGNMKTRILVSLVAALFAIGISGLPISYAAAEFEWGDTAALKEHLESHVKYPATGKAIKESCKVEMPDEFAKQQRAYLDSKLKDDTTYKNAEEVLAALNLK